MNQSSNDDNNNNNLPVLSSEQEIKEYLIKHQKLKSSVDEAAFIIAPSLISLYIYDKGKLIGEEAAILLANALSRNSTLKELYFYGTYYITRLIIIFHISNHN